MRCLFSVNYGNTASFLTACKNKKKKKTTITQVTMTLEIMDYTLKSLESLACCRTIFIQTCNAIMYYQDDINKQISSEDIHCFWIVVAEVMVFLLDYFLEKSSLMLSYMLYYLY